MSVPLPHMVRSILVALPALLCLASGCDNDDDAHLWGDSLSPTQIQKDQMGPGPIMPMPDPSDGDNEDPFISHPNYPFVEEPWSSDSDYSGG